MVMKHRPQVQMIGLKASILSEDLSGTVEENAECALEDAATRTTPVLVDLRDTYEVLLAKHGHTLDEDQLVMAYLMLEGLNEELERRRFMH